MVNEKSKDPCLEPDWKFEEDDYKYEGLGSTAREIHKAVIMQVRRTDMFLKLIKFAGNNIANSSAKCFFVHALLFFLRRSG
ncbi:MAG: hypothetical protein D3923_08700 [Candidatus Electrothrix sp. AR3]|nr:hypothetical protein [Candidatus Electrothrix sp. AR3]